MRLAMGGDGMGGLAIVILLAMVAMVAGGFLIFFFIGRRLARNSPRRSLIATLVGIVGLGLGYLAIFPMFFENSWSPPPRIRLETPAAYAHPDVILLLDRNAPSGLVWEGSTLPFSGQIATLAVPAGGVVRLKDIGPLYGRVDATVEWPDGVESMGGGGGPAPAGIGAESYTLLVRDNGPDAPQPPYSDDAAMAEYIRTREAQN